jgi:DNA-directed RNA polymerase specialized sigma24 family protein
MIESVPTRVAKKLNLPVEVAISFFFDVTRHAESRLDTKKNPQSYLYKCLYRRCMRYKVSLNWPYQNVDTCGTMDSDYARSELLELCQSSLERVIVRRYLEGYTQSEVQFLCQTTQWQTQAILRRLKLIS